MAQGDPSGSGEPALNGVEGVVLVSFLRDVGHWVEGERGMAKAGRVVSPTSFSFVTSLYPLSYVFTRHHGVAYDSNRLIPYLDPPNCPCEMIKDGY